MPAVRRRAPEENHHHQQTLLLAVTNAIAETLSGKLHLLKATGWGYRRFANFRTIVLFHCGALDLFPLKPQ